MIPSWLYKIWGLSQRAFQRWEALCLARDSGLPTEELEEYFLSIEGRLNRELTRAERFLGDKYAEL